MNTIFIKNLIFSGIHGVKHREKQNKQNFEIDLTLVIGNIDTAVKTDRLADAVDYIYIKDIVRDVIEGESKNLIESLAESMAKKILQDRRILKVTITITKHEVWGNGRPGIMIERDQLF